MTPHRILGGALAVQVALAVVTWWPSSGADVTPRPLVEGGGNSITELTITPSGDDATDVWLARDGDDWVVKSAHGYPADADKVGEVLDTLGDITLARPIATRAAAHEGLKVSPDAFDKKVVLRTDGGDEITAWIGAAASKAVNVRLDDEDDVYVVKGLSAWSLKDDAKGYLPTNHVEFAKDDVETFEIANAAGSIGFTKLDGTWTVDGRDDLVPDTTALDELVDKASRVRLAEVASAEVLPEQGLLDAPVRVSWSVADGDQTVPGGFVIGAETDGGRFLKADDSPFVVVAPGYRIDPLIEADPSTLVKPAPPVEDANPPAP